MRAVGSPVSDGGRGLKLEPIAHRPRTFGGSPVSDGGRGLKHVGYRGNGNRSAWFARQRWRAWIETADT